MIIPCLIRGKHPIEKLLVFSTLCNSLYVPCSLAKIYLVLLMKPEQVKAVRAVIPNKKGQCLCPLSVAFSTYLGTIFQDRC